VNTTIKRSRRTAIRRQCLFIGFQEFFLMMDGISRQLKTTSVGALTLTAAGRLDE